MFFFSFIHLNNKHLFCQQTTQLLTVGFDFFFNQNYNLCQIKNVKVKKNSKYKFVDKLFKNLKLK